MDLLLTHGFFLADDPKELVVMKPYAPLGILYLSAHLKRAGFSVDVFAIELERREITVMTDGQRAAARDILRAFKHDAGKIYDSRQV